MNRHRCATCRFYQEARLASSGWCHHPQRKVTSDLMIMVRKHELACRDEWAHDLWEPRSDAGSLTAIPLSDPFPDRKMPPATELEIAALVDAERTRQADSGSREPALPATDVILSELAPEPLGYVPRQDMDPRWMAHTSQPGGQSAPATPVTETGPRSAIIKAREAYRERSRQQAARAAESARLERRADLASNDHASSDAAPLTAAITHVDASHLTEVVASQIPVLPTHQPDPWFQPDRELPRGRTTGDDVVPRSSAASDTDLRAANDSAAEPYGAAQQPDNDQPEADAGTEPLHVHRRDHFDGQPLREPHVTSSRSARSTDEWTPDTTTPTDLNWQDERSWLVSDDDGPTPAERASIAPIPFDSPAAARSIGNGVDHNNIDSLPAPPLPLDSNSAVSGDNRQSDLHEGLELADESWLNVDVVADNDNEPFLYRLADQELSAHLPRLCQTCRDYRPAEAGDRGWCANPWAFSHRRMVDADEVTPCEGTLGNWWLPVDEVWSEAADVSSHGQPTPLLDAWLPQHRDEIPARRRS